MMRGYGPYNGYGMMGGGWLGALAMLVIGLIVVAVVVLLVVWAVRSSGGHHHQAGPVVGASGMPATGATPQVSHDEAVQVARRRYAAGEISKDQFDEMMKALGN
jgi:uncharacterized membrane protein